MKKSLKFLCLLFIIPFLGCFTLTGCTLGDFEWDINDGFDTEEYIPPDYDFTISAESDSIKIYLSNIGEYGQNATLVALPIMGKM